MQFMQSHVTKSTRSNGGFNPFLRDSLFESELKAEFVRQKSSERLPEYLCRIYTAELDGTSNVVRESFE